MSKLVCSATWHFVGPVGKFKDVSASVATIPEQLRNAETPEAGQQTALAVLDTAEAVLREQLAEIRTAIETYDGKAKSWTGG